MPPSGLASHVAHKNSIHCKAALRGKGTPCTARPAPPCQCSPAVCCPVLLRWAQVERLENELRATTEEARMLKDSNALQAARLEEAAILLRVRDRCCDDGGGGGGGVGDS